MTELVLRSDLKQRDVRALETELLNIPTPISLRSSSIYNEAMLKAAIGASWIESPECKRELVMSPNGDGKDKKEYRYYLDGVLVDDMHPKECYQAGHKISQLYGEFTELDPN